MFIPKEFLGGIERFTIHLREMGLTNCEVINQQLFGEKKQGRIMTDSLAHLAHRSEFERKLDIIII